MIKYSALLLLALCVFTLSGCKETQSANDQPSVIIESIGGEHRFYAELALTQQEQMRGLMFREEMPKDTGMLFYFGRSAPRSFWMKNTLIPLDIIFIAEGGRISHIHKNAVPLDETPIPSNGNAIGVFEINAGLTEKLGIAVGDKLKHDLFN